MKLKIAIIGFGSMGKMLFEKIAASKIIPEKNFFIANRTFEKIESLSQNYKVNVCKTNAQAAKEADIVFLCVRPGDLKKVLLEINPVLDLEKHIVSLNGSIKFEQLEQICTENKISKVIPSVTAEVNKSQTLVCHNKFVQKEDSENLNLLLKTFGNVIELPEEEMGMGSELVSCMPGFIAALFKEVKNAAMPHTKIEESKISKMIADTLLGTARLISEKNISFEQVIERVATKGGITEEGVKVVENKFPEVVEELFEKTLEKRAVTAKKGEEAFCSPVIKNASTLELKTQHLILRPVRLGDEKQIHEYAGDKSITMMFWLPNETFEETEDFVRRNSEEWDSPFQSDFEFVITYEGKIIGGCDCDLSHSEDRSYCTLGWIVNKDYRGRGFATEAGRALVDFAFSNLDINRVLAQCDCKNPASFGVMKNIGMKLINDKGTRTYPRTGIVSGEYTCELTREDWEKGR